MMDLLDIIFLDVKFHFKIFFCRNKMNIFILGVRPLSFLRVPLYASGERTVKAPIYVRNELNYVFEIYSINFQG
jgi:hypothetical protein